MKAVFTVVFALLALVAQAQTWPRNPQTGKVEFRGVLPWPAGVKTDAQRRALARRWYLSKLTDATAAAVEKDTKTTTSSKLLTYDKLPIAPVLRQGSGPGSFLLGYIVILSPVSSGLSYTFSEFSCTIQGGEGVENIDNDLEDVLNNPSQPTALAVMRQRIALAVMSW